MDLRIYYKVEGNEFYFLHWRVFKLVRRDNGSLVWDCEDILTREQFVKDRYPDAIKYPPQGRVAMFPFNQEKWDKSSKGAL